jgi:uncharacterized protein YndB with AHSA1/START domain
LTTIERTYDATPEEVWELWTTASGIEAWSPPEGFSAEVTTLDVRPGGELAYTFTATEPGTIEFMQQAGMPLTVESRKTFTEVEPPRRIAYRSLVDFVPGVPPYEQLTIVEIEPDDGGSRVTMQMEPMHDDEWTQRLVAGRTSELDNLAKVIERRR